jgi:prepilin-type N-terminal cleavage/methylation domain-containing protein
MNKISAATMSSRTDGFTLIEMMAAMVVMAVGLFAIIQLQLVSIRGNAYAQEVDQAAQLAMGVMDDLRVKALEWSSNDAGSNRWNYTFENAFPDNIYPVPEKINFDYNDVQSLMFYKDKAIAASNQANTGEPPINVFGENWSNTSATGVLGGVIYRVHYTAYRPVINGVTSQNIVRVTVYVSWDSKDHGDYSHAYDTLGDSNLFIQRHMVKLPFVLAKTRI